MANHKLQNEEITISVNTYGAELKSLKDNKSGKEYMWDGDPAYWGRTSPVLFPIVGSLKNKEYHYNGNTYPMSQHGFARDMEFELIHQNENSIHLSLSSNEETLKVYPFQFKLELGYEIKGKEVKVFWKVINVDTKTIYFSIGGHPAFICPPDEDTKQTECFIEFDAKDKLVLTSLNKEGLATAAKSTITLKDGLLPITSDLFDKDALIFEDNQAHKVSLLGKDKIPYITVTMKAPLFGIWSPTKKEAPFICIEPWYGRCDGADFAGPIEERKWGNKLEVSEIFEESYTITVY